MKTYLVQKTEKISNPFSSPLLATEGRILVVEDSPDNQVLLKAFLSKKNWEVHMASNGAIGVAMALEDSFDLIIMDIQMPEMDGYEAVQKLRVAGYTGKIIALTACAMKGDREKCLDCGFDDYLCKPISRDDLIDCVSQYLR